MRKAYWLGKLYPLWGCGVAYMNNPEDFSLGTWRNRASSQPRAIQALILQRHSWELVMTLTDSEILDLVYLRHLHALPDNRKEPEALDVEKVAPAPDWEI